MLVRVTDIKPEVVRPLDEVKEEIRKDLALVEANRILLDVHDTYEDARAGGASHARSGRQAEAQGGDDRRGRPRRAACRTAPSSTTCRSRRICWRRAFETEANVENPPLNVGSNGFVFYEVEGVTPARDRTLDEVRDKVVADWKAAESRSRLAEKAGELEKRLKDGDARLRRSRPSSSSRSRPSAA